jgi:peptidoglycan hydrolase-like amidase
VGAAEMGRQGKKYAEILAYYYPGTRLERAGSAAPR